MVSEVKTIGFELECEIGMAGQDILESVAGGYVSAGRDGSIHHCLNSDCSFNLVEFRFGIFNNDKAGIKRIKDIFEALEAMDKEQYHYNASMGFHIHLGFEPERPPEVLYGRFVKTFLTKLKADYPDVWKLRAENRYCKTRGISDSEIVRPRERRKAVNYASLSSHGTVEFRIFPATEPSEMLKYVNFTLKTVEDFMKQDQKTAFTIRKPLVEMSQAVKVSVDEKVNLKAEDIYV